MPHRVRWTALVGIALFAAAPGTAGAVSVVQDLAHRDHRDTPQIQFEPAWSAAPGTTGESRARAFLTERAADYGIADLADLRLSRVKESLLGTHYTFQQQIGGIDVDKAEFLVSIAKSDGRIYRTHNNLYPVAASAAVERAAASLTEDDAYDAAWNRLRVHGELVAPPSARLVWVPEGKSFRLTWITNLELDAPYGGWEVRVDAVTGQVIGTRDARLYRIKDELTEAPLSERIDSYRGPVADRAAAFAKVEAAETQRRAATSNGVLASGTGNMFDPDPRTTLQDDNLQDGDPAGAFTAAYFTRNLLDITFSGGLYRVTGPWVDIIDWDTPSTAPSTTVDGNWTAVRGNNAMNDCMTYYMIDTSQRYMQSLGFTGPSGIQEGPIGTDTDGFQGADNSFYTSGTNRMSFGHGCVDDSEDADVMLHEYGHAINHSINPSWSGGDTGAMGEGFGDYWAGSYSITTLNGDVHHPDWVFSWDGHGTGNQCWPGRIMSAFGALYDSTTTYGAHSGIPGGFQSDELWSTPCFQTLLNLINLGHPRSDCDQIVLEAQFGLGAGVTMRGMANAIIQTAGMLFPAGPHADEFIQSFLVHNIVNIPVVSLNAVAPDLVSAGANNAADPGETVTMKIDVTNAGALGATAVSATLTSSTPGVVINQGSSAYPDLGPGVTGTNATDYSISVPGSHTCGDPIALTLTVDYDDGAPNMKVLNTTLGTGVPQGASVSATPGIAINDNSQFTTTLTVTGTGATVTSNFSVDMDITHTYQGDLVVTLWSPSGTPVILHNGTGGTTNDIIGNYPDTLTPAQPLSAFLGEPLDGLWELVVADNAGGDTGTLNAWGINDISSYDCDAIAVSVTPAGAPPTRFALDAPRPNPFGSATAIRYAVPGAGAAVTLEVFDIAGRLVRTLAEDFQTAGFHTVDWNGRNDSGQRVGAGIYFYRLQAGDFQATRKVTLLN